MLKDDLEKDELEFLDARNLDTAIRLAKRVLVLRCLKEGLYNDFGMEELEIMKRNFINDFDHSKRMNNLRKKLQLFEIWAINYGRGV